VSGQSISAAVWRDSVQIASGKTFTNRITLRNTGVQQVQLQISLALPAQVQLLSSVPESLTLAAGEVAVVPIKGLISQQGSSHKPAIGVQIRNLAGQVLQNLSFSLVLQGETQSPVSLYTSEETIVLFRHTETARLSLHLVNNLPAPGRFYLDVASMPEGVDRSAYPLSVSLLPGQDTAFSLPVKPLRHWSTGAPYQVVVTVRDGQKATLGSVIYKVVVAVADKRFTDAETQHAGGYGASTALTRFSSNQWSEEGRVWGHDSVGRVQLDFQLHYTNYGASHQQQLQNSYVTLRTNQAMVRLGSSYDYHELPLLGRGLKVNIGQSDQQWTFWAINSTPDWLSADLNAWSGNIVSARFDRQLASLPGSSYALSSSYFTQANTRRAGYLTYASFRFDKPDRHLLTILGGQSVEFSRFGANRAQTIGWTGQVDYQFRLPKLSWQWRSCLSSPVYAGIQKGAKLLYSQLFWQPRSGTSLLARLNYAMYTRSYFTNAVDYTRQSFGNVVAEVDLTQRIRHVSLSLRPYWFSQSDQSSPYGQRADAFRLAPAISYYRRPYQRFDITYDLGLFYNRSMPAQSGVISRRLVSSMVLGPLSFWGYWQKGPYYLFDLRTSQPGRIMTTSLTPMLNMALFNRRLIGSAGLNYLYDAYMGQSRYTAVGRIQVEVTPSLIVNLSGNGTPYSQQPEFAYSQYRLEVIKHFNGFRERRHGQLQLSFFEDANGNGNKDAGEPWMDSLLVTVNDNTLLTNAKGSITYRNIPPGTYTVSALSAGRIGDPVLYHEKVTIGKSVTKVVALSRTFRVTGKLQCQTVAYDKQPCQLNRFAIDIHIDDQLITSASPLPDGSFVVHLPSGSYTLYLRDYGRQPQSTVKVVPFTVTQTGQHPVFNWVVDGSTRAVEVKRFTQK
jgi:hypothetical protein